MAESTIEWTRYTFNPWVGCTKVADGCTHCYAESYAKRTGMAKWGPGGTRTKTTDDYWRQPLKWNAAAEKAGVRARVFCASLADVFEEWDGPIVNRKGDRLFTYVDVNASALDGSQGTTMADLRRDLFDLIDKTPWLDWLLLTKRPENIWRLWEPTEARPLPDFSVGLKDSPHPQYRPNVWLMTSIATQADADRNVPLLLKCRELVPVLGLSAEPLLGELNLRRHFAHSIHCVQAHPGGAECRCPRIDWVIVGGESGAGARPCDIAWIRSIIGQCKSAGVPCFVKQLGASIEVANDSSSEWPRDGDEWIYDADTPSHYQGESILIRLSDKKGGDPAEWPEDLRVRQYPVTEPVTP
jgi:protein gp37